MQLHRNSRTFLCRQLPLKGNPGASSEQKAASFRLRWSMVGVCSSPADDQFLLATDLPGILSCAHWTFLTFKCWTCCFKHLCILEVQGVASCLADFPPLALLPVVFRLLLRLARKVLVTPLARERALSPHTSSLTTPSVAQPSPQYLVSGVWCQQGEHSSVTLHPGFKQLLCLDRLGSSFNEPSSKEMQISWVTFAKRKRILFEVPSTVTSQCFFLKKKTQVLREELENKITYVMWTVSVLFVRFYK